MNALLVSGEAAWQLAGWTMLHFLWVGAIVALVGGAMRMACRWASPGVRYGVSLLTLVGLAAAPVGIAMWLGAQRLEVVAEDSREFESLPRRIFDRRDSAAVIDLARTPIVVDQNVQGTDVPRSRELDLQERRISFEAIASWLPWVWLAGAPVTFALLATGLVGSRRLRRQCAAVTEGAAFETLEKIKKLMGMTRRVALAACEHVAQPVLVGIVRPTILLPAAALTGWSPEELEMVLVHELAHVRRWDNLVNLMQRLVESALFFHPAVWLASRQVRRDREECCDAAVVAYTRRPAEYAELLVSIAGRRTRAQFAEANLAWGSAMADHPLAGRIRRILKLEDEPMWVSRSTLGLVFVLGASLLAAVLALPPTGGAVADDASTPPSPVARTDGGEEEAQDAPRTSTSAAAQTADTPPAIFGGTAQEDDLRTLQVEIENLQSQLSELQSEKLAIEALCDALGKDVPLHSAFDAAVEAELDDDPQLAIHQQQMFQLMQAIQQLTSATRNPNSAAIRALSAKKQQAENKLREYRVAAEKSVRDRLGKNPTEAVTTAQSEYKKRAKSVDTRLTEVKTTLKAALERYKERATKERKARDRGDANFLQFELPKLKNDIALYQSQLLALEKEREDIAAFRERALQKAIEDEPQFQRFQQQIAELDSQIQRMAAADVNEHDGALRKLQAKRQRVEKMLDEYRRRAESETDDLGGIPNDALRAAMGEFHIRARSLAERKRELEQKLKAAEARITEMAARGGDAPARSSDAVSSTLESATATAKTYERAATDFELAQVQEKIRTYRAALMAQEKEAEELEVRRQVAELEAQQSARVEARVEEALEKDRRSNVLYEEAISLEQEMRRLREVSEKQEEYDRAAKQYAQLTAEAEQYRAETAAKYRDRLAKAAEEAFEASLMEYKIRAKALDKRRKELAKNLQEAEAQLAELAKLTGPPSATQNAQNPYYFSPRPRLSAEISPWYRTPSTPQGGQPTAPAAEAASPGGQSIEAAAAATGDISGTTFQPAQAPTTNASPSTNAPRDDKQYYWFGTRPAPTTASPKRVIQPFDVIRVTAAGISAEHPIGDDFTVEAEGTLPLGPVYGRVKVAGLSALEAQEAIERHLAKDWRDPHVQVVISTSVFAPSTPPAQQPGAGAKLVYDGRTFEEWQRDWRNELKTERRSAAIHALAAFGRAGMAEEAAEEILEVAGQYDFYTIDNQSTEGEFKRAVIDLLTSTTSSRLRESAWMPALVRRLEADPVKWKWLAVNLLQSLYTEDSGVREQLFGLAQSKDAHIRSAALLALVNSDPSRTNAKVVEAITHLVRSSDADEVKTGIGMLSYSPRLPGGRWTPPRVRNAADIAPHLFHEDESVRQTAREALVSVSAADARPIVAELMKQLKSEDVATKLEAIRGLAAIGPHAADAQAAMRDFIVGADAKLAAAATVALDRTHPDANLGTKALTEHLNSTPGGLVSYDDQTLQRERASLFTPRENQGGGGFGGGGRGGF